MRRSAAPGALASLLVVLGAASGCVGVQYRPRTAPPGDPPVPAARLARLTWDESLVVPGEHVITKHGRTPRGSSRWARPMVTREGLIRIEQGPDIEETVSWQVHLSAGPGAEVLEMRWAAAAELRCAGGLPALDILVDDAEPIHGVLFGDELTPAYESRIHWERPVVIAGERLVTGRFYKDPVPLELPSVVDVRLRQHEAGGAREVCVRVPVTGPGITFWSQKKWSLGARLTWRRSLAFSKSSTLAVGLSLGRWLGPVRLGLGGTLGGTPDVAADGSPGTAPCFADPGPACDNIFLGTLALEANGLVWRWSGWAVGWSASYETIFAGVRPFAPPATLTHAVSGGPRLALQLLSVPAAIPGAERFSPTSAWGVELFAAAASEWRGAARGTPLTFGASLLAF
jgi:hypothetical protein